MIDDGHTLVVFLPMDSSEDEVEEEQRGEDDDILIYGFMYSRTVPLDCDVHVTGDLQRRENTNRALHKAMKVLV